MRRYQRSRALSEPEAPSFIGIVLDRQPAGLGTMQVVLLRLTTLAIFLAGCVPFPANETEPAITPAPAEPIVLFSEVMYHPILEQGHREDHEFLELVNAGEEPINLANWRIEGGLEFTFDATTLEPGDAVLVVENTDAFFMAYPVPLDRVAGTWSGGLSNAGETLSLRDPAGRLVDELTYSASFPWPLGADGLGAGIRWIEPPPPPLEDHRFRGRSLQRVSVAAPTNDPGTWIASELGGANPGVVDADEAGPRAVVTALSMLGPLPEPLLPGAALPVSVTLNRGTVDDLALEWWADNLSVTGEIISSVPFSEQDGTWVALVPAQIDKTILRMRVVGDRGAGPQVLSPRPGDPMAWHVAFVGAPHGGETPAYQLFIDLDEWTQLWDNTEDGRVVGCEVNPLWNAQAPAVFVDASGAAFDVRARYQGSRWNRRSGGDISPWTSPGPQRPDTLRALSWRVAFPRYAMLDGDKRTISLNKLNQACPGLSTAVGFALFSQVEIPVPRVRYRRLFINGGYYHYTQEIERPEEALLERFHEGQALDDSDAPAEPGAGHLFKSVGCTCDEGPFGWGDGRVLEPACGYTKEERYAATYDRKTHTNWAGPEQIMALVERHAEVRDMGSEEAMRIWLGENFDLDAVLSYLAVINWAVPFDDMFQNHYLYQRRSDDRWSFVPWDLDQNFGGWKGASASIYMGEQGDPDNRADWWSRFKDSFLWAYRPEYEARLLELNNTVLHPEAIATLVGAVRDSWSLNEAAAAPAGLSCDWEQKAVEFVSFAEGRQDAVNNALPTP